MDDQRDHAEEAANRTEMQGDAAAELADEKARDAARRHVVESINDDALDAFASEGFDVEAIIDELRELTGDFDFDKVENDQFMAIVAKHDNSNKKPGPGAGE